MRDSDKSSDAEEVENFAGEIKRATRISTTQIFCLRPSCPKKGDDVVDRSRIISREADVTSLELSSVMLIDDVTSRERGSRVCDWEHVMVIRVSRLQQAHDYVMT